MSSKYVQEFKVPEGFPEVLRDFTREVLRDQPKDMNRYGYEYFMEKLKNPALPSVDGKKK